MKLYDLRSAEEIKTEKMQSIRKACIKANSTILDLVFGCEIKRSKYDKYKHVVIKSYQTKQGLLIEFLTEGRGIVETTVGIEHWEIKGRKIVLSDVLNAYETVPDNPKDPEPYTTHKFGRQQIVNGWNYLKENLTEQSDEYIDFIFNLLTPN